MPPKKSPHSVNQLEKERAERIRHAIKAFMADRNLKVLPWCKKAKVSEGTLRAFLKGDTESMLGETIEKLAEAENISVSTLTGEITKETALPEPSVAIADSMGRILSLLVAKGLLTKKRDQYPP